MAFTGVALWIVRVLTFVVAGCLISVGVFVVLRKDTKPICEMTQAQFARKSRFRNCVLLVIGLSSWVVKNLIEGALADGSVNDHEEAWANRVKDLNKLIGIFCRATGRPPFALPPNYVSGLMAGHTFGIVLTVVLLSWLAIDVLDIAIHGFSQDAGEVEQEALDMAAVIWSGGYAFLVFEHMRKKGKSLGLLACLLSLRALPQFADKAWEELAQPVVSGAYAGLERFHGDLELLAIEVVGAECDKRFPRLFWRRLPRTHSKDWYFNPMAWFLSQFLGERATIFQSEQTGDGAFVLTGVDLEDIPRYEKLNAVTGLVLVVWFFVWLAVQLSRFSGVVQWASMLDRAKAILSGSWERLYSFRAKEEECDEQGFPLVWHIDRARVGRHKLPAVVTEGKNRSGKKRLKDLFKIYEDGDFTIAIPKEARYDSNGRRIEAFWLDEDGNIVFDTDEFRNLLNDVDEQDYIELLWEHNDRLRRLRGESAPPPLQVPATTEGESSFPVSAESATESPVVTQKQQKALRKVVSGDGRECNCAHVYVGGVAYVIFPAHVACGDITIFSDPPVKGQEYVTVPSTEYLSLSVINPKDYKSTQVPYDLAGFKVPKGVPFFSNWTRLTLTPLDVSKVLPTTAVLMGRERISAGNIINQGGGMLSHKASTNNGDCGGLLVVSKLDGASRYVGMHVAGAKTRNLAVDLRYALPSLEAKLKERGVAKVIIPVVDGTAKVEGTKSAKKNKQASQSVEKQAGVMRPPSGLAPATLSATAPRWTPSSATRLGGPQGPPSGSVTSEGVRNVLSPRLAVIPEGSTMSCPVPGPHMPPAPEAVAHEGVEPPFRQSPQDMSQPQPGGVDSSGR